MLLNLVITLIAGFALGYGYGIVKAMESEAK